jgi:predicted PurR-regulated permease PerM
MENSENNIPSSEGLDYRRNSIHVVVVLLLLKATFNVLLLILAGAIIAVLFLGINGILQRKTGWQKKITLPISILASLVILVLLFWLIGAKVQSQSEQLSKTLPETIKNAKQYLNQSSLGQKIVQKVSSPETQKTPKPCASLFSKQLWSFWRHLCCAFSGHFFYGWRIWL